MKIMKKSILFVLTISILCFSFYSLYIPVCASDHGGGGGSDHGKLTEEEKRLKKLEILDNMEKYLLFLCSEIGVFFNGSSYSDFYDNYVDYETSTNDKWFENNVSVSDDGNAIFSETLMISLKTYIDQYAKEHEPYYMVYTYTLDELLGNGYATGKLMYDTAKNLLNDSPSGVIVFGATSYAPNRMFFADIGNVFRNISPIRLYENDDKFIHFYDNESLNRCCFTVYYKDDITSEAVKTAGEFIENSTQTYEYGFRWDMPIGYSFRVKPYIGYMGTNVYDCRNPSNTMILLSEETRRIRVFNTYGDFQNYTLGKRSVYYTSNYYNYVPEDLTVSIDDLQKEIDDLSNVIDELLIQISKDTDESEIEELLQQILNELRNQQSEGGGGSSGSGNVTVNFDMKETNNWLSKIYSKLCDISDKISSSAGQFMSEVVISIENLKLMLQKYLKEITGDLDDIKGQLEEMSEQEFSEKTESFLDDTLDSFSEISEKAKGKFPFSIPNDIRLLISKMSVSPPEDPDQGTYSVQTMSFDAAYESNGLITVMDEGVGDVPVISETGAPIFYIPFVIASAGIEEYVLIDLSGFESISSFCRSLMTIYFILCLFNLTFKVMGLWGDLVD